MKNLLNDPDVAQLYQDLQSGKYKNVEDYMSTFYEESTTSIYTPKKQPELKMFWGGEIIQDFEGDNDYGL